MFSRDTNMDYIIDVLNSIFIADRLDLNPADPMWDPITDVNAVAKIHTLDMIEVAKNLDKTYEP